MGLLSVFFPAKKKPEPTEEEKRVAGDAAKLAEFTAFDTEVGAWPTQVTLQRRFREAIYAGHTGVVKDTMQKGLAFPNEITDYWFPPFGGDPMTIKTKPLEHAAQRQWADMVEVMVGACDKDNLDCALRAAEHKNDIGIAKTVRAEMAKREGAPLDPTALAEPISVRKSTLQLK